MKDGLRAFLSRLAAVTWRRRREEADDDEELRFHLDMEAAANRRRGLGPEEARRRALIGLGGLERAREACREERSPGWLADLGRDLRFALRLLRRAPGPGLLAVLSLALGLGAATALYAILDLVLLAPLPYAGSERIVTLWESEQGQTELMQVSPGNWLDWRERTHTLAAIGLAEPWGVDLATPGGRPESLRAWRVTEGFFAAMGARPVAGRSFAAGDWDDAAAPAVVLSHGLWQRRFGGDPGVVGTTLRLDGVPVEVVGVLPAGFDYPHSRDLWLPMHFEPYHLVNRTGSWMWAVGRLEEGVSVEQARADLERIAAELAAEHPDTNARLGAGLVPLRQHLVGEAPRVAAILLAAVCGLLLLACSNVAGLLLSRTIARRGELAVRRALGASRSNLVRQLAVEALLLVAAAAALGLALAHLALTAFAATAPLELPGIETLRLDAPAVAFAVLLAAAVLALSTLAPALHLGAPGGRLRASGTAARGGRRQLRLQRLLTVAQVAVALVLLIGAGLLARSLALVLANDLGFRTRGLATAQVFLHDVAPAAEQRLAFVNGVVARLRALPGAEGAAAATSLPLHPEPYEGRDELRLVGEAGAGAADGTVVTMVSATPGWLELLRIPLRAGRRFTAGDRAGAPRVAVINETLARHAWPDGRAVGRRISVGFMAPPAEWEVVGVVADVRPGGHLGVPRPEVYVPYAQTAAWSVTFVAGTAGDAEALLPALREAVWAQAPELSLRNVGSVEAFEAATLAGRRFPLRLLGAFSLVALVVACVGIYSLVAFIAARRLHELGIRAALGARRRQLVGGLLREVGGLVAAGVAAGLAAAALLTRYLASLLHEVDPVDPPTFLVLAAALAASALAAAWLPARRAARADPLRTLRAP
jgi:predicted permease